MKLPSRIKKIEFEKKLFAQSLIKKAGFRICIGLIWIQIWIRSQHFVLIADPDPFLDLGFWWPSFFFFITVEPKIHIFVIKNCMLHIPGLHKGLLNYRISLQPLKENIPNIKTWISLFFILFLWFIAVLLDLYWNLDKRKLYLGSVNLYWIIFKREQNILHVLICITVQ